LSGHHLLTAKAAQELFGVNPPGPLRQSIIQWRQHAALIEVLLIQLTPALNEIKPLQNENQDTVQNYLREYRTLMRRFLETQINTLEQTGQATFDAETVRNFLAVQVPIMYEKSKDKTEGHSHQARIEYMLNPENISRYFRIENPVKLTRDDLANAILVLNEIRPAYKFPANSENLEPNEMDQLIAQESANPHSVIGQMLHDVQTISVAETESAAINPLELNETLMAIRNAIVNQNIQELNHRIYAFLLRGSFPGTRNNQHLIAMVLEIAPDKSRRYTIIDSENNVQLFRGPAATCIRFLEGCDFESPADRIQQITESLARSANEWLIARERLDNELLQFQTSWGTLETLSPELRAIISQIRNNNAVPK